MAPAGSAASFPPEGARAPLTTPSETGSSPLRESEPGGPASRRAVLAGERLTKAYDCGHPDRLAPRGVDLAIEPEEMAAIMGPSGCGKSTLLRVLGGLDVPTSGSVFLCGERFDDLSEGRRAVLRRWQIGYVFQFFNLVGNLSVADNVVLPMLLVGRSRREARARRDDLLGRLGLADHAAKAPRSSRAASSSESPWRAPSPTSPRFCWRTADRQSRPRRQCGGRGAVARVPRGGPDHRARHHDEGVAAAAERLVRMEDGRIVGEER
jgi:putative ABC transport system ATP-binding protein